MAEEASRRRLVLRVALGALLSFVGAVTLGNAPYLFVGYGLSAFAVFFLGLTLRPREAVVSFVVGMILGAVLDLKAESVFLFVGVGAVVVRTLQIVLLVRLRPRLGDLAALLVVLLVGVFLAIAVGLVTFGGEGLQPAFAVFDVVYIGPAWLVARVLRTETRAVNRAADVGLVAAATFVAFASAGAFLLPAPLVASVIVLALVAAIRVVRKGPTPSAKRVSKEDLGSVVVIVALLAVFLVSGPSLGSSLRALAYPVYPDSLAGRQWIQTSSAVGCRQGDLAGGRTQDNGTWGPSRLRVLGTCVTVTGVVAAITPTYGPVVDRDFGIDLRVDPGYARTLSLGSYVLNGGLLHVEIVPSDQADVLGNVIFGPGDHISVTGVWVLDTDHGWTSEIHPAWAVAVVP